MVWSDPAPRSARRSPLRDVPVPEALPEGPSPTCPSDLAAKPLRYRSPGGAQHRAVFREPLVAPPQSPPLELASRCSSLAGRHTPACFGSASRECADRWSRHGSKERRGTFSPVSVPGRNPSAILPSRMLVWRLLQGVSPAWPNTILSGHAALIIL